MKIKKCIICCFVLSLFLVSCNKDENNTLNNKEGDTQIQNTLEASSFSSTSVSEFETMLYTGNYTLIDIRTPGELLDTWIIAWAINIDSSSPSFKTELERLDKSKSYLIYCRSWSRTRRAVKDMRRLWFTSVNDLAWWIIAWQREWRELVK